MGNKLNTARFVAEQLFKKGRPSKLITNVRRKAFSLFFKENSANIERQARSVASKEARVAHDAAAKEWKAGKAPDSHTRTVEVLSKSTKNLKTSDYSGKKDKGSTTKKTLKERKQSTEKPKAGMSFGRTNRTTESYGKVLDAERNAYRLAYEQETKRLQNEAIDNAWNNSVIGKVGNTVAKVAPYVGGVVAGLGAMAAPFYILSSMPKGQVGYEPTEQDSIDYANMYLEPELVDRLGTDSIARNIWLNSSDGNDRKQQMMAYLLSLKLGFNNSPTFSVPDNILAQLFATTMFLRPSWNDAKRLLQDKGYVEWSVGRKTKKGNYADQDNGGLYPQWLVFRSMRDSRGVPLDESGAWGVVGQSTSRWYPNKGGLYVIDSHDFNKDAIISSLEVIRKLLKKHGWNDEKINQHFKSRIPSLEVYQLADKAGVLRSYGEALADPKASMNIRWHLTPSKIRSFFNPNYKYSKN